MPIDLDQINVNITDTIPPENFATIDKNTIVGTVYTKAQDNEWRKEVEATVQSGIKGVLKPNTPYDAVNYPYPKPWAQGDSDLYEKYDVNEAGNFPSAKDSNGNPLEVLTQDLDGNEIQIWIKNGVAKLVKKTLPQATKNIPQFKDLQFPVINTLTEKVQTIYKNYSYQLLDGFTATSDDIPDQSYNWQKINTILKAGKNKFNKETRRDGYYVNQVSGVYQANPTHIATAPIQVKSGQRLVSEQYIERYAFFDSDFNYISGATFSDSVPIIAPDDGYFIGSSPDFDVDTLQIEIGSAPTSYEDFKEIVPESEIIYTYKGEDGKKYVVAAANIRTPKFVGDDFAIHKDAKHEPCNVSWVTAVGTGLDGACRVGMSFTAKKVITMSATPHVSMREEGYDVATTGGDNVHAVFFYKNGVRVDAMDVVIPDGSFWYYCLMLVE